MVVFESGGPKDLHDNVAVDLVNYVRSNTIRNEQQFLLLSFAYASGLFDDTHNYISSVAIGTSSSGKSHLKDKVDELFEELNILDASTGSDKALIYDDGWDRADIISMGELQQPGEEMLEFLKRAHGGDEEVVIKTTRGNPNEGFETETIRKEAKSYHFTYAQWDADFEFWNRLLKVPVHESESKNRAVGRMAAGHTNISLGTDEDTNYGYPYEEGTAGLQEHMADVKAEAPKHAVLPTGDEYGWDVWEILEPIFNHGRSESNRIYAMTFNLVRASALVNYKSRETVETTVGNGGDTEEVEAILVEPQDVANIARCLRALRATTHEIDRKKRAIVEAIRSRSGPDNAIEGVEPIREFLQEADAPVVKRDELENILEDLRSNFLIEIDEEAGEGGKDVYTAFKWDALGIPRIAENEELFEDCTDPMSGDPFLEVWEEVCDDLETTAQDLLKSADIDSSDRGMGGSVSAATDNGDAGLNSFGGGRKSSGVDLNPWVEQALTRIEPILDGNRIRDMRAVPVEAFLGLTSLNSPDKSEVDTDGTMLDPTHDIWDQSTKPDTWVETETEARRRIQEAIDICIDHGIIGFDTIHSEEDGAPVDATLSINRELVDD